MSALLDDLDYEPQHPPVNGAIPAVVEHWGRPSQLRWFRRFGRGLDIQPAAVWDRYWCTSEHHKGLCCRSCEEEPHGVAEDGWCCCRDERPSR